MEWRANLKHGAEVIIPEENTQFTLFQTFL